MNHENDNNKFEILVILLSLLLTDAVYTSIEFIFDPTNIGMKLIENFFIIGAVVTLYGNTVLACMNNFKRNKGEK